MAGEQARRTGPGAQARNDTVRATRRLGRPLWRRWSGYHRRSLVETRMRCFKLLGERVMARDFDRQVAELQIRAFAGFLGPVAFTRSLHEPLHSPWNAANSTRGVSPFKGRENSTSDYLCNRASVRDASDANGDSLLQTAEILEYRPVGAEFLARQDTDGDGGVSSIEFEMGKAARSTSN